ncbi:MAG: Lrp/AsnC family transcriptional regulator [Pseudomonadota bacterium]
MIGPQDKKATTTSFEEVDQIDLKIMEVLQQDARITNQALADRVALSPSACLRRVRDLETRGLISAYRAQIQVDRISSVMAVIAQISFSQHSIKNLQEFDDCIEAIPEIVESFRVSGNIDYMLRVVVPDIHAWKRIMTVLVNGGFGVEKITSHFLLDQIKTFKGYKLLRKSGQSS